MAGKRESAVMSAVYDLCDGTESCLVSPSEILAVLPSKLKLDGEKLEAALLYLQSEGYFDLISSERKGEKMYVINLRESGLNFRRQSGLKRKEIAFKILLALIGATATFVFGLILKALFG